MRNPCVGEKIGKVLSVIFELLTVMMRQGYDLSRANMDG